MALHDFTQQDLDKISKIKKNYDLDNDKDVLALFAALQAGQVKFQSKIGMDFDDMIYNRAMEIKHGKAKAKLINKNSSQTKSDAKSDAKSNSKSTSKSKERDRSKFIVQSNNNNTDDFTDHKISQDHHLPKKKSNKKVVVLTKKEWIIRRFLMVGLLLIGLTCLGYFSYYCIEAYQVESEAKRLRAIKNNATVNDMYEDQVEVVDQGDEIKYFKVLDQYKSLYNQNKNLIGWIKIADTIIDYPVMQTTDNEYYLTHNISLEEDKNGTLFMDASCDIKKPSTNYIIYGHNMRSGKMFGALDKYESESYYEKHKYIEFDTIYEQSTYEIMYVFRSKVYQQDEVVFKYYQFIDANSEDEFNSYMKEMADLSFYDTGVTAEYGDYLLTLSTCDYEEKEGRFVIVAKKIS